MKHIRCNDVTDPKHRHCSHLAGEIGKTPHESALKIWIKQQDVSFKAVTTIASHHYTHSMSTSSTISE
jgi:hypothetical protein